jgi:hypothetical protein
MRTTSIPLALLLSSCVSLVACGGGPSVPPGHFRQQLRDAMTEPVGDRDQRDAQSRRMAEAIDGAELEGLDRSQIRAAIGRGRACNVPLCSEHGFSPDDWYYEMGQATSDDVKQLPVLIIGFDHKDRAVRVWTLTTHD